MQNWIKAAAIAVSLTLPGVALAQSLESLVNVQGVRENQLVGYSLVVGLDGTGDKNQVKFTNQTITNMLRQFGVQLPNKIDPKVKNVAAVAVSATLPPMYSRGQTIDVTVSSIGDAKSIRGGTLLLTQLHGADGEVYALAQGSVVVGGINTPTAGLIPNGATVEREIPSDFQMGDTITLNLKRPSFKDANNIAAAINASFGGIATAQSSTNVTVRAPTSPGARVAFMSQLDDAQVQAEKIRARVVFNSRTGTVVMGDGVALHAAAVSHGSLTVSINETSNVSQPNAFAGGRTAVTPQSNIAVNHARPGVVSLPESSSLKTLVNALNSLGATPDDIMSILQALHEAGALDADLEVAARYADTPMQDIAELAADIDTAEAMRKHLNEYQRMVAMQGEVEQLAAKSEELTRKIELARDLPGQILETASIPTKGLTGENGVPLIHGLPIRNLSVDITVSKPGQLGIILVDGAERLDDRSRAALYERCKAKGLQLIATRVSDSPELEVVEL